MQTVKEVISRIQFLYNRGVGSDDSRLRPRHVYHVILSKGAKVLEERLNKLQKVGDYLFTPLPCVPLIPVSAHDCCLLGLEGCIIWRTECKLPTPITTRGNHMIESVTSVEGNIRFEETTWQHRRYTKYEKYTSKDARYFIHGDYLYVINNFTKRTPTIPIKFITLRGLWFDPIEALRQCSKCGDDAVDKCKSLYDMTYNVIGKDLERIIELATIELVDIFNRAKEDKVSDGQEG